MDSLTQAALGACVAGAIAPKEQRRKALLAGAALGTLPDLDVLIDFGGAVENFTYHRGFSHSLFVLAPFSVALWWLLRRLWAPVRGAPWRWLAVISLTLLTHPLIDAHTAYGTQLFWPLTVPPTMWATLFIIDPLYTLPLVVGVAVAAWRPLRRSAGRCLQLALVGSTAYLCWSWLAQSIVHGNVRHALADRQLENAPVFIAPTPFNTVLWRIVVLTEDGFLEGYDSLLVDEGSLKFVAYPSDVEALQSASGVWAVERLRWFSSDFVKARVEEGRLILSDLRMGYEPEYVFSHVVAARGNPHWHDIPTELLPVDFDLDALGQLWRRLREGGSDAENPGASAP